MTDKYNSVCTIETDQGIPKQYFLTAAGDGSGDYNLIGNYSDAGLGLTDFYVTFPKDFYAYTILIGISDDDKFTQEGFAAIGSALTNGIKFFVQPPGGPDIPLLGGLTFKKNYDWTLISSDIKLISYEDTLKATRTLSVLFDIKHRYGKYLDLAAGASLKVRLNDDFSGLIAHSYNVGGIEY